MNFRKVLITTGDVDGIGFEVAVKSLSKLGPPKRRGLFNFRAMDIDNKKNAALFRQLDKKIRAHCCGRRQTGFRFFELMRKAKDLSARVLIDVASELSPAHWVEFAALACFNKEADAMVTGPISKTSIREAGFKDIGHTDILKRVAEATSVHMGFIGQQFNVVLTTAHIPLSQVVSKLNFKSVSDALLNADSLRRSLPKALQKKPIAILGLNPHAGEEGLLGPEENAIFPNLIQFAREKKIPVVGPLVPDAAFLKQNWSKYSVYLTLYHDQGLIPFKTVHGQDSGVHITLGIPFYSNKC